MSRYRMWRGAWSYILLVGLMALCGCGGEERGETSSAEASTGNPDGTLNAATEYRRIYKVFSADLYDQIAEREIEALPSDWTTQALEGYQPLVEELIAATRIDQCDFGIEYIGVDTLLPHLAESRKLARVLAADAVRHADEGRSELAADRIIAIIHMSRHVAEEGPASMIAKMIGVSLYAIAQHVTEAIDHENDLTAEARSRILQAVQAIDVDDPFDTSRALEFERLSLADDIRQNRLSSYEELFGPPGLAQAWSNLSKTEREAVAQRCDAWCRQIQQVWMLPGATGRVQAIEAQFADDPWMPVFAPIMYSTFRTNIDRTQVELRRFKALLAG